MEKVETLILFYNKISAHKLTKLISRSSHFIKVLNDLNITLNTKIKQFQFIQI